MNYKSPEQFDNVTLICKANVYFDGKVVSHGFTDADGNKKSTGLVFPGTFTFNTEAAERMEVIAGSCRVKVAEGDWEDYTGGSFFDVPANSHFDIVVSEGICEYVCSFA